MSKIHFFTDCIDFNAKGRNLERFRSLFPGWEFECSELNSKNFIPVLANAIDQMDAVRFGYLMNNQVTDIFIFNLALRTEKKYPNGAPFCFARLGQSIIIGNPDSFCLLQKLRLVKTTQVVDIYQTCFNFLGKKQARHISRSQYRSYDFIGLLSLWLYQGNQVVSKNFSEISLNYPEQFWHVDCFGNGKTTIPQYYFKGKKNGELITTKYGDLPFYERLSEVPVGVTAIVIGSSGYGYSRFAEIVTNGGSAADNLKFVVGDLVF